MNVDLDVKELTDEQLMEAEKELSYRRTKRAMDEGVKVEEFGSTIACFTTKHGTVYLSWSDGEGSYAAVDGHSLFAHVDLSDMAQFTRDIGAVLESESDGHCAENAVEFVRKYEHLMRLVAVSDVQEK